MVCDKQTLIERLFSDMCHDAGCNPEALAHRRRRFTQSLMEYPEDLLCAAYCRVRHYARPDYLPSECDFILFMSPEYNRRRMLEAA